MRKLVEEKAALLLRAERLVKRNLACLKDTKLRVCESLVLVDSWRSSALPEIKKPLVENPTKIE
jgi:hypothetical protein